MFILEISFWLLANVAAKLICTLLCQIAWKHNVTNNDAVNIFVYDVFVMNPALCPSLNYALLTNTAHVLNLHVLYVHLTKNHQTVIITA